MRTHIKVNSKGNRSVVVEFSARETEFMAHGHVNLNKILQEMLTGALRQLNELGASPAASGRPAHKSAPQ